MPKTGRGKCPAFVCCGTGRGGRYRLYHDPAQSPANAHGAPAQDHRGRPRVVQYSASGCRLALIGYYLKRPPSTSPSSRRETGVDRRGGAVPSRNQGPTPISSIARAGAFNAAAGCFDLWIHRSRSRLDSGGGHIDVTILGLLRRVEGERRMLANWTCACRTRWPLRPGGARWTLRAGREGSTGDHGAGDGGGKGATPACLEALQTYARSRPCAASARVYFLRHGRWSTVWTHQGFFLVAREMVDRHEGPRRRLAGQQRAARKLGIRGRLQGADPPPPIDLPEVTTCGSWTVNGRSRALRRAGGPARPGRAESTKMGGAMESWDF